MHPSSFWLLDSFEFEKLVKFRCGCWKALLFLSMLLVEEITVCGEDDDDGNDADENEYVQ